MVDVDVSELRIVIYPDPVLKANAQPVADVNDQVRAVAARMTELMYEADGVGLAAPQVGLSWKMFVTRAMEGDEVDRVFVNPTLTFHDQTLIDHEEGCLSLPGITSDIRRPRGVTIEALDANGDPFSLKSDEFPARVWQHEYDHLMGVLIIDRQTMKDRLANRKAIKQLVAEFKS